MDRISIVEVTDVPSKVLRESAARIARAFVFAVQKGAAHAADPERFPIAHGGESVEEVICELIGQLPPERQRQVKGRALAIFDLATALSTAAGMQEDGFLTWNELAQLEMTSAAPIVDQAMALWRRDSVPALVARAPATDSAGTAPRPMPDSASLPVLQFRIRGAACLTETVNKTPADEMHLSGLSMDASGHSNAIADMKLGDFTGGDNFPYYPSPVISEFDLSQSPVEGPDWPRAYFVTLLLAEIRQGGRGGFGEAAGKLLEAVQRCTTDILTDATVERPPVLRPSANSSTPQGPSIAAVVGWVLTQVFSCVAALFEEKLFAAVTLRIDIPSLDALQSGPRFSQRRSFQREGFGGVYRIFYDWHLGDDRTAWSDWAQLDGELTSAPAAVSWDERRIDVFVRGQDGQMWQKTWQDSRPWGNWIPLGGQLDSAPAAVSWGANRVDCFCRTKDNHLWHKGWDGTSWSVWEDLGGEISSAPAAASWGPDRIDVFARGLQNQLVHRAFTKSAGWGAWVDLGGQLLDAPAAVSPYPGSLHVYIHGLPSATWELAEGEPRNGISHLSGDGTHWGPWEYLGGSIASAPSACSSGPDREDVFARGTDGQLYHRGYSAYSGWSPWEALGGQLTDAPAVVGNWGSNMIDCFIKGADNHLWQRWVWGIPVG